MNDIYSDFSIVFVIGTGFLFWLQGYAITRKYSSFVQGLL
ncbi:hypothetical protein IMCC21906_02703 [Spongiibacter sp. IMCC21906]|nr:hypothetical protein IMCC21906_02703 [Spongiibacter sp. IMCC21906]